jgi:maltose alpha-D-glucosyltransferase / alpha-amylase
MSINDLWYKNAVMYCLDVEKYQDADGDGVGDFEGLMRRLDYLQGLGVTCVWLQPFYKSPNRDNGYDVTDYYNIHEKHGPIGDQCSATGTSGPTSARRITEKALSFPASRRRRGRSIGRRVSTTFTASTIINPI